MNRSLLVWGARGRRFESFHTDHFFDMSTGYSSNAVTRFHFRPLLDGAIPRGLGPAGGAGFCWS